MQRRRVVQPGQPGIALVVAVHGQAQELHHPFGALGHAVAEVEVLREADQPARMAPLHAVGHDLERGVEIAAFLQFEQRGGEMAGAVLATGGDLDLRRLDLLGRRVGAAAELIAGAQPTRAFGQPLHPRRSLDLRPGGRGGPAQARAAGAGVPVHIQVKVGPVQGFRPQAGFVARAVQHQHLGVVRAAVGQRLLHRPPDPLRRHGQQLFTGGAVGGPGRRCRESGEKQGGGHKPAHEGSFVSWAPGLGSGAMLGRNAGIVGGRRHTGHAARAAAGKMPGRPSRPGLAPLQSPPIAGVVQW